MKTLIALIFAAGLYAQAPLPPSSGSGGGGGGGGTGCVPVGLVGQILTDDGAGGCTSNTPTISGSTITASLTGHASLDLPLTGGTLTGNLLFSTDNTKDIGASGATRPRDFFLGRNALVGGTLGVTGNLTINVATGTQCLHANSSGVVSGTGSDCGSGGGGITIGTTTITSGTTTRILYDNGGVVGEYTVTGSSLAVLNTSPLLVTPHVTTILDGNGNPFLISSATASAVNSITITNSVSGAQLVSIGASGTDSNLSLLLLAKGAGSTGIGPTSFTPTHTLDVFDATASTGATVLSIKEGAGQSTNKLFRILNGSNAAYLTYTGSDGTGDVGLYVFGDIYNAPVRDQSQYSLQAAGLYGTSNFVVGFGSDTTIGTSSFDTGLSRISAGVVGVGTGAAGSHAGTLQAATIIIDNSSFTFNGHTCAIVSTVMTCP